MKERLRQIFRYDSEHPGHAIYIGMLCFACLLIVFGFSCDTPMNIVKGYWTIMRTQAGLITDSLVIGGAGAGFVNAGVVTLLSIRLLRACKITFSGMSIACLFLMAGFSLFGKDPINSLPIILGGFLYAKYKHDRFGRYLYISLFGTSLSPLVTELSRLDGGFSPAGMAMSVAVGILIGFLLPPVAAYTVRIHQGYNLYNVGFATGIIGMALASLLRSMGYTFQERLEWGTGNNLPFGIFMFLLCALMFLSGFWMNKCSLRGLRSIVRHSGRAVADFVLLDGFPVTLMNMGVMGAVATGYVLVVGGEINGPTIGGIFTICGFSAFGKHLRNCIPVVLGVVGSSILTVWQLNDPGVLLAALFATCLAPIAGQFGVVWGLIAGALHASVVLNVGFLHGGLNLYNNGFSAGLICIILIPLIEALCREKPAEKQLDKGEKENG